MMNGCFSGVDKSFMDANAGDATDDLRVSSLHRRRARRTNLTGRFHCGRVLAMGKEALQTSRWRVLAGSCSWSMSHARFRFPDLALVDLQGPSKLANTSPDRACPSGE